MARIYVEERRTVNAAAQAIYAVLTDYRTGHPTILPPEHFLDYGVEKGGQGAGTIIHFRLRAAGRERPYTVEIAEPDPGHVLSERDVYSSLVTTWTLTPVGDGQRTNVQIATEWEGGHGIGGFFERTFAPGGLQRIYAAALERLAQTATSAQPQTTGAMP
jgi:hypothetical protein